ncbi:MAG: hypothetical protein WBF34_40265 [Streptosporangiaceae bacterium]
MLYGFFAREWERTCTECGYTWRVPRSIARRGIRGMSALTVRGSAAGARRSPRGNVDLTVGLAARAETMEGFRICARCGVDHFTQRPLRRGN